MYSSQSAKEFDFHVRWPGVKLLTSLLKQQGPQVQQIILISPMGECCSILLLSFNIGTQQMWWRVGGI